MKTGIKLLKWATNITSAIILALVGYIIAAHFLNPQEVSDVKLSTKEICLAIAMGAMFLGAIVAFWKRTIGGLLSLVSFTVFSLIQGTLLQGNIFYVFAALGIANLVLGYYQRK